MLNFINNLSIRFKLIGAFSIFAVISGIFVFMFFPYQQKQQIFRRVEENSLTIAKMTADNLAASLEFQDKVTAQEVLSILQENADFEFALLKDFTGKLFAGINLDIAPVAVLHQKPLIPGKAPVVPTNRIVESTIITTLPIQSQDAGIGCLILGLSIQKAQAEVNRNSLIALGASFLLGGMLILASIVIGNLITRPLQKVINLSSTIAEGDFTKKLKVTSRDEIGRLSGAFNEMITKLDKSIGELARSEERYERLIEFADVGIITADKDKITQVNKKAAEIYGYTKEELLGQPPNILTTETYTAKHKEILDEILKYGKAKKTVFEEEGIRKDGSRVPIEISYSLSQNDKPDDISIIAIMRDITERKNAEKEIQEARDFLENIINNSVDGIMICDPQGEITRVNEALKKMTGYTEEEIIGKHTSELASKGNEHAKLSMDNMTQLFEQGFLDTAEAVWKRKDGVLFPIEVNMALLKNSEGDVIAGVSSIRDITDRKKHQEELKIAYDKLEERVKERTVEFQQSNEQLHWEINERKQVELELLKAKEIAESANKAKSDFLANMSHELRTPLNHIIGFTELVLDKNFGDLNETQSEYLGDALQSSKHLLSLINDILDLSKVEAGKQELQPTQVHLEALLERSLVMFKEKAMKHGLHLSIETNHIPEIITADERKLKQIIYNLVSNAVKFTPEGGSIIVSAHMSESGLQNAQVQNAVNVSHPQPPVNNAHYIQINVADSGIGIDPNDLERIFNPFEQVDGSSSRRYQGTGLGLSLCRNLVELHGGAIWVESAGEGKGTTFSFVLPL
jgi:PAS domain S-box-containing protein